MLLFTWERDSLLIWTVKWYCNECKENMRRGRNGR